MPPSMNHAYATFRNRRIKSRALRAWENALHAYSLEHRDEVRAVRACLAQELEKHQVLAIHASYYFSRARILTLAVQPKRLDTSNFLKALHDGLSTILSIDDKFFWDGTFTKHVADGMPEHVDVTFAWRAI